MYKYSLHKKPTKHNCPNCGKKRIVLYIDNETQEFLSDKVGRCDREINCGYHFTPKQFIESQNLPYIPYSTVKKQIQSFKTDFHSTNDIEQTLNNYEKNVFIKYLFSKFNQKKVQEIIEAYKIGTAHFWNNGTIFWQIDCNHKIRGGKIIIYKENGKRTKYINWFHSIEIKNKRIEKFNLKQCLFGQHLIHSNNKPIAIVESEKTACIMSIVFEKHLWLATGSLNGLSVDKIKTLQNRKIILYPDLGIDGKNGSPFTIWNQKYEQLKSLGFDISISDLLENNCSEIQREKGLDIADYFTDNLNQKPKKIKLKCNPILEKMYQKNKEIKNFIEVFNLANKNGSNIII